MTPIGIVEIAAAILWCYALVLAVAWFRAVAHEDSKLHVGHFVSLMGVLVPGSVSVVFLVLIGAVIGLPSVVVFLAILFPAGFVIGLQLEVSRLTGSDPRIEARRIAVTLGLAIGVILWRGFV